MEAAIEAIFRAEADNAFTVEDLCDRVYADGHGIERKHRVAVSRAARKVCRRIADWKWEKSSVSDGALSFWNLTSVLSYAMYRLKADTYGIYYRPSDQRVPGQWRIDSEQELRAKVEPGGEYHHYIVKGGAWAAQVERELAERDGHFDRARGIQDGLLTRARAIFQRRKVAKQA